MRAQAPSRTSTRSAWSAELIRCATTISAPGFEHFFRELADLISAGPPQAGQVPALAERYGLQFGQPAWLPGVISRFGLTAPGAAQAT
jgi:hypothetical protein